MIEKTTVIKLYNFDELSPEAQKVAHEEWKKGNDYMFLSDCMNERLYELLKENNIIDTNDTSKAGTKPTPVMYSLSYSQGDGAMFEGRFKWRDYIAVVKHSGHYYHYNSKTIAMYKDDGINNDEISDQKIIDEFNEIYVSICKKLARYGYDFIEYQDSLEAFIEACEANGYTFEENGTMNNL